ncbi:MAG: hypothetical protein QOK42_2070 [Frankiaceae bacterium]|jgi:hypothetical protein|nr:hypothetical protein [Frankiaceae bacterium]
MRKHSKKLIAAVAGTAAAVALSGVAYAYWTTTGAGTGTVTNASSNGTVTLHASWPTTALFPGGSQSVSFTADNGGATDLYVGTIHLASVSVDAGHATCVVGDFTMPDVVSNTPVIHGASGQAIAGTGTLSFANNATTSQDTCKGADITLHLTSN